jgi:hypothetical protein
MVLDNLTNCKAHSYKRKDGSIGFYIFISDNGYCFRNNAEPLKDEEGNTYFDYPTAFTLFACEIDKLADYDCIQIEDNFIIH